ncbi:hypothetical protein Bbelb_111500 [Branchiostoma belcheri]|nr:hypothetical protein Bbelb_111500 [Branchiostoma belcheri]
MVASVRVQVQVISCVKHSAALDSKFCYPGRCPGRPSTCSCAPGFGGNNCLRISTRPTIMHCLAKLMRVEGGAEKDTLEAGCGAVTAPSTVYVGRHIAFNRLQMTWDSSWIGPTTSDWPRPYYINDFRVGVVTASSTWRLLRGNRKTLTISEKATPSDSTSTGTPSHRSQYEPPNLDFFGSEPAKGFSRSPRRRKGNYRPTYCYSAPSRGRVETHLARTIHESNTLLGRGRIRVDNRPDPGEGELRELVQLGPHAHGCVWYTYPYELQVVRGRLEAYGVSVMTMPTIGFSMVQVPDESRAVPLGATMGYSQRTW